jgi:hypothetical protein
LHIQLIWFSQAWPLQLIWAALIIDEGFVNLLTVRISLGRNSLSLLCFEGLVDNSIAVAQHIGKALH